MAIALHTAPTSTTGALVIGSVRWWSLPVLVGLLEVSLWSAGCARNAVSGSEPPEVYIAKPLQRDVSIYSDWIGTTVGFVDAQIHSQVTGYLLSQNYKEGSLVKKGDLLFQVDPRPFQALVDQARAKVEAAKTQLTEANAEVDQAKAEIDRAQAALGKTELDVKRYSPLVSDGTVSQQELDDAVQANLANKASVAAAQGRYARAKAQVATAGAELNLGFTRVTAPVSGIARIFSDSPSSHRKAFRLFFWANWTRAVVKGLLIHYTS